MRDDRLARVILGAVTPSASCASGGRTTAGRRGRASGGCANRQGSCGAWVGLTWYGVPPKRAYCTPGRRRHQPGRSRGACIRPSNTEKSMGESELRAKYGGKLAKAINRAIRGSARRERGAGQADPTRRRGQAEPVEGPRGARHRRGGGVFQAQAGGGRPHERRSPPPLGRPAGAAGRIARPTGPAAAQAHVQIDASPRLPGRAPAFRHVRESCPTPTARRGYTLAAAAARRIDVQITPFTTIALPLAMTTLPLAVIALPARGHRAAVRDDRAAALSDRAAALSGRFAPFGDRRTRRHDRYLWRGVGIESVGTSPAGRTTPTPFASGSGGSKEQKAVDLPDSCIAGGAEISLLWSPLPVPRGRARVGAAFTGGSRNADAGRADGPHPIPPPGYRERG